MNKYKITYIDGPMERCRRINAESRYEAIAELTRRHNIPENQVRYIERVKEETCVTTDA